LNQEKLLSCTGNGGTHCLATDSKVKTGAVVVLNGSSTEVEPLDENYAINLYSAATQIDEWEGTAYPPDDTGSSALAIAKVLKTRGLIDVYNHCFSLDDVLGALQYGPVMLGTNWYQGMFTADERGLVTISGEVAGGHEYLAIGIEVERREIICINSWGSGWGVNGTFRMNWNTLSRLLDENGDAMVLHMTIKTAPTPPAPVVTNGGDSTFHLTPSAAVALHKGAVKRKMTDDAYLDKLVRGILHVK
jgi:hypothetical protein